MARRDPIGVFHRIVVGCDGSSAGSDAVALGSMLAGVSGAGLTLAGVYPYPIFPVPESMSSAAVKRQVEAMLRRERDTRAPGAHLVAEQDLSVPRALRRVVRRMSADLIVLGSGREAPPARVTLGPRARQLLHHAPCATVVAPHGYHERVTAPLRIGVGYDGGEQSRTALRVAAEIAQATGGRLRIHEVTDDRIPLGLTLVVDAITGRAIDWAAKFDAEKYNALEQVERAAASVTVPSDATTAIGDPGPELRALSLELDLLVLGSLRFDRRERLAIGTTAESVLDGAACPVLVVPHSRVRSTTAKRPPTRARRAVSSGLDTASEGGFRR